MLKGWFEDEHGLKGSAERDMKDSVAGALITCALSCFHATEINKAVELSESVKNLAIAYREICDAESEV